MGTIGTPDIVTLCSGRDVAPKRCWEQLCETVAKYGLGDLAADADPLLRTSMPVKHVAKKLRKKYLWGAAGAEMREIIIWSLRWRRMQLEYLKSSAEKASEN